MTGASSSERCLIFLELAEKIAMEDPQRRKLRILHENGSQWQVTLGASLSAQQRQSPFPTLEQALEDFVLRWHRVWLGE